MAQSSDLEHSIHIAPHGAGQGEVAAPPERLLNCFVRSVALIERLGNALGTLAFTWATVVLLGGYADDLIDTDFWSATAIFFLEAIRMFSRNNRMDYQLFFGTRGAFRPLGWNRLILIVYINGLLFISDRKSVSRYLAITLLPLLGILVALGHFMCSGVPRLLLAHNPLRRAISLWSPMVAIILLGPSIPARPDYDSNGYYYYYYHYHKREVEKSKGRWAMYMVLLVVVLLVTISRMMYPSVDRKEFWRPVVLYLCMIGALGIMLYSQLKLMILAEVCALVFVSSGNLQIPAAIVRVVLPLIRLSSISDDYAAPSPAPAPSSADKSNPVPNFMPSLYIFYGIVLGQGVLYVVACMIEIFSFIPRRSLVRHGGFKGQKGVDSVNLYYAYALEKCLERNVLAPNISLCNFAIDSLKSDSTESQLHGIRVTHILLQRDRIRTRLLIVKLNASTETMTRLMRMMDWTGQGQETIRMFAVKVIAELANKGLLVVTVPGIVQNVSLLLDDPLLDADDEQEQQNDLSVSTTGDQIDRGDAVPDQSTEQGRNNEHDSWIVTRWRRTSEFWSIPQEELLTEKDLLPVLGMSIIESLANYDQSNCEEISKATGLIRKITKFTSLCKNNTNYTDAKKKVLVQSSLKLFHRLTSIDGEIGITLRHKISKHPFLLSNLSEMLGDNTDYSDKEMRKLAAGILRNLAVDASMRQTIGGDQRIITRLMDGFLAHYLKELSDISGEVLERIGRAEGAELEILIGLSSHIYKANSEKLARVSECSQVKKIFEKWLVDARNNANMEPNADCPGIRRVILEQAINLMEYDPRIVNCFRDYRMMEAVSMVEETISEAENYSFFMDDVGLMEAGEPLSSLVAKAKQLLASASSDDKGDNDVEGDKGDGGTASVTNGDGEGA